MHLSSNCGKCQKPLTPLTTAIDVDASVFQEIINNAQVPVLIDFWAPWCGPCKSAAPHVSLVAKKTSGNSIIVKLNTEQHPAIGQRLNIQSIPTFAIYNSGKEVKRTSGVMPAKQLQAWMGI